VVIATPAITSAAATSCRGPSGSPSSSALKPRPNGGTSSANDATWPAGYVRISHDHAAKPPSVDTKAM
jgi:hypothetical protein